MNLLKIISYFVAKTTRPKYCYTSFICLLHVKWPLPPGDSPIAVNKYYYYYYYYYYQIFRDNWTFETITAALLIIQFFRDVMPLRPLNFTCVSTSGNGSSRFLFCILILTFSRNVHKYLTRQRLYPRILHSSIRAEYSVGFLLNSVH
jgi:hypothetical protein